MQCLVCFSNKPFWNNFEYVFHFKDVPKANITTEKAVSFGSEGRITSVISSCPIFEEVSWQKSSDSISFETIDITEPNYFGSKLDSSNPDLIFSKATFDDRLYYRLFVRNKIGKCLSNVVLLNVTGGMYFANYQFMIYGVLVN